MSHFKPIAIGLALPLTLTAQTAFADLTPAQVWEDWRQYMEGFGYQVQATQKNANGNLTVDNMNLSFPIPDNGGTVSMTLGAIAFNQNSDGTVSIVMPDTMPMRFKSNGIAPGADMDMSVTFSQMGHSMIASGDPDAMVYDYAADTMVIEVDQQISAAQSTSKDSVRMTVTARDVTNKTTMTIGDMREYDQTSNIASAAYEMDIDSPQNGGQKANLSGAVNSLTMQAAGLLPLELGSAADMSKMLAAGFDMNGTFSYTDGSSVIASQNPRDGNFNAQTSSQGGTLGVKIGADGLAYTGSQKDLKMAVTVAAMPFPIELAMAQSGFNLKMPVQKSEAAQDFAFGITMANFTMSDLLWSIFDGAGQLPRDPATIMLDLSGKAKVLVDFMNPDAAAGLNGAPGELEAIKLNTLLIDAVGARLEGSGDITLDKNGPAMVPGMGSPVGAINIALAGGNGLMDKLTAMGLLQQEQAMGARMMMGIFAVPGDGPDTLKSKIEFTQDGQVLANGQRIR